MAKAFTLWEVMLIIIIIGIIAFIVIPSYNKSTQNIKSEVKKTNTLKVEKAAQLYYLDNGRYPEGLKSLTVRPEGDDNWRGPYMDEILDYIGPESFYAVNVYGKVIVLK